MTFVGKIAKPVPKEEENIGVDTQNQFASNLVEGAITNQVDLSVLDNFLTTAQNREALYNLIDTMGEDSLINSIIESYAEDATQRNADGRIIWIESNDPKVQDYGQYLLDVLQVDKNAFSWEYSLIKYGDLYLRNFRESDFKDEEIFDTEEADKLQSLKEGRLKTEQEKEEEKKEELKESITLHIPSAKDHFANYVEDVANPGEMFELTKRGKTMAFIKAPYNTYKINNTNGGLPNSINYDSWTYNLIKDDVEIYPATEFVHAYLNDSSSRTPEEVNIFNTEDDRVKENNKHSYLVRRGKSILYDWFKAWREMSLVENSVMLNRLTKSSIVRLIQVEVGDMPKEQVAAHLQGIKGLFEQKTSIDTGKSMGEYTNPGPVENNVYVPVHQGIGNISIGSVGGDVDPKQLTDLEYFRDKFFSGTGIPKQYFGFTEDGAGFNGGQSLTIVSSKYAKRVVRYQTALIYAITDLLNILFLDKGLKSYINNFTIKMVEPVTQENIDLKDAKASSIQLLRDTMDILQDVDDKVTRLKILVELLKNVVDNTDVIQQLNEFIEKLEQEPEEEQKEGDENSEHAPLPLGGGNERPMSGSELGQELGFEEPSENEETNLETAPTTEVETNEAPSEGESDYLPTGNELGIDLT